jgi:hypothetical protein
MHCRLLLVLVEGAASKEVHERGGEHGRGDGSDQEEHDEEAVVGEEGA